MEPPSGNHVQAQETDEPTQPLARCARTAPGRSRCNRSSEWMVWQNGGSISVKKTNRTKLFSQLIAILRPISEMRPTAGDLYPIQVAGATFIRYRQRPVIFIPSAGDLYSVGR
jgi:hypothetical protein